VLSCWNWRKWCFYLEVSILFHLDIFILLHWRKSTLLVGITVFPGYFYKKPAWLNMGSFVLWKMRKTVMRNSNSGAMPWVLFCKGSGHLIRDVSGLLVNSNLSIHRNRSQLLILNGWEAPVDVWFLNQSHRLTLVQRTLDRWEAGFTF